MPFWVWARAGELKNKKRMGRINSPSLSLEFAEVACENSSCCARDKPQVVYQVKVANARSENFVSSPQIHGNSIIANV